MAPITARVVPSSRCWTPTTRPAMKPIAPSIATMGSSAMLAPNSTRDGARPPGSRRRRPDCDRACCEHVDRIPCGRPRRSRTGPDGHQRTCNRDEHRQGLVDEISTAKSDELGHEMGASPMSGRYRQEPRRHDRHRSGTAPDTSADRPPPLPTNALAPITVCAASLSGSPISRRRTRPPL